MANPKQRRSKSARRTRKAVWKMKPVKLSVCPQCHQPRRPHFACETCGYYNGRQAIVIETPAAAK